MRKVIFLNKMIMMIMVTILVIVVSCDENELPGVGDVPDESLPMAAFDGAVSDVDVLQYNITNLSIEASDYVWTVPAGVEVLNDTVGAIDEKNLVVVFPEKGDYVFTLKASDKNGKEDTVTDTINVVGLIIADPIANFDVFTPPTDAFTKRLTSTSISTATISWEYPTADATVTDGGTAADDFIELKFAAEGTYSVSLTATNLNGVENTITKDIVVAADIVDVPVPVILEPSFEDGTLDGGTGDGRDSWRNADLGGVIQINSSSSLPDGAQAAKFPSDGSRIAYQEIDVTPDKDFELSFFYALNADDAGSFTISILNEGVTDPASVAANVIQSFTATTGTDFASNSIVFNSGTNSKVAIYITNAGVETRVDNLTIQVVE